MTVPPWHEEAITRKHDRGAFDCGDTELNRFLLRYARQSHEHGGAKTFLAIADATSAILGFYSLAPASLAYQRAPEAVQRGLARQDVPGFRLARIAIDRARQGQGLGGQLLLAAGRRCLMAAAIVGGTVLIIDAKSDRAAAWYVSYGAVSFADAERTLVLPLATIESLLREAGKLAPGPTPNA
jgi:GNAT superfamily N-acetyltransferase